MAALSLCFAATACVKAGKKADAVPAGDVAVWEFPPEPADGTTLFPPDVGTPQRMKRHLGTHVDEGRLFTVVESADPQFFWQFETAGRAFGFRVEIEAAEAGSMQLFWATPRCPIYSEACSAVARFGPGRGILEWVLDPGDPLRSLRLDPPEKVGTKITFDRITVRHTPAHDGSWEPNALPTNVEVTPLGLDVQALEADPWLVVRTPGLDAKMVSAIELVVRAPATEAPKLYWQPAKEGFSERCSLPLPAADSGALTHRGILRKHPCWSGRIETLRLDPGQSAGHYVVERVALVQSPTD
jgi:hypothetical protein